MMGPTHGEDQLGLHSLDCHQIDLGTDAETADSYRDWNHSCHICSSRIECDTMVLIKETWAVWSNMCTLSVDHCTLEETA